jgi:pyrroloquinoline quinone (PQQ) biosynthesis protein C
MPAMFTLDQERGIRITSAVGPMRWADFLEIYRMIANDPNKAEAKRTLVDLRHASLEGVTRADVQAAVNLPKLSREIDTRLAIVTKSPVVYGLSHMYAMMQAVRQTGEVQVFTTLDEAMAWLVQ